MYLLIFEDGSVGKIDTVNDTEMRACDDGTLDVIDISDPGCPKSYYQGEWHEIDEWKDING